jgi:hypothetical protein
MVIFYSYVNVYQKVVFFFRCHVFPKTEDIDAIAHLTPKVEGFSSVLPGAVDLCITVPE